MSSKIQSEIGLILSYIILLAAVLFWNMEAFNLLLSLIVEYITLLLIYLVISAVLTKSMFELVMSTLSHLFNGIVLGLVQGLFVFVMAKDLASDSSSFDESVSQLPWLIPVIAIPMMLIQLWRLRGKKIDADLSDAKMGELIFSAVTFPAIILAGMLAYEWSGEDEQTSLIAIVMIRIAVEIWKNHFQKKKKGSQKKTKKIPA